MSFLVLLGIAVSLGMDAMAVAIATGVRLGRVKIGQWFRMAGAFGLFQFIMPIIGWLAGRAIVEKISLWDHWVAFALLAGVGGHMVFESWQQPDAEKVAVADSTRGMTLLVLAVATSLDALAVGLSFSLLHMMIWWPAALIGAVALVMTTIGMLAGCRLGMLAGKRMETAGGVVLIVIGLKILLEHLLGR